MMPDGRPTAALPARRASLPVLETEPARRGPDRGTDRKLTFAGVTVAALFLAAAAASLALPPAVRLGWWLPLHLTLAGAAGTAIAAMLPFFVAALAVAPPAPAWLHGSGIALVATGAALAGAGRALDPGVAAVVPTLGALAFVLGAAAVAASALLPLRHAAGPRRPVTEAAYVAGLACVMAGVTLAGLYLAGVPEVLAAWSRLRVAHAWLNLFGFVGLVVAGTLLHFAPTVAGARIRSRASGRVAVGLLAAGVVTGVAGYVLDIAPAPGAGAALLIAGAAALVWHGIHVQRDAVGWKTDADWHHLAGWSLLAAPAWLLVAAAVVGRQTLGAGSSGSGWRLETVAGPLIAGFVLQALLGSMAHLVPAIGPLDAADRAAARRTLGTLGTVRVLGWNLGTLGLTLGVLANLSTVVLAGATILGILGAGAMLTLFATLGMVLRKSRSPVGSKPPSG